MNSNKSLDELVVDLRERAKELNCLYEIQELLSLTDKTIEEICKGIIDAIPPGWQYPDICQARLELQGSVQQTEGFKESKWVLCAPIVIQDEQAGQLCVSYTEERPKMDEGPFLKEERKLINTIAEQLGMHLLHRRLKKVFEEKELAGSAKMNEWEVVVDLLQRTDPKLLIRISRKMVNYLYWNGIKEARNLLEYFTPVYIDNPDPEADSNRPYAPQSDGDLIALSSDIFNLAGKQLSSKEVLSRIQKWIKEDRSGFLVNVMENMGSSLAEISNAIERFHHLAPHGLELSKPREKSLSVALITRLLSEQHSFINIAKNFINVDDFTELMHQIIFPVGSQGKLGGKSSGLFLAKKILKKAEQENPLFKEIKTPKTWYLTSDGLLNFMSHNNLEDIIEQKYKEIGQVRQEYPYIIHIFKNASFAPEIIKGLSLALDDFGEVPLIVRSSSLLEDRLGAAFAGKYKSLFIANQGSKQERLVELLDAISEVYASTFSPDPIEYRSEHNLLDYHEEMGILIQEVVGNKIGPYFFPAFAGVSFSYNEFRWSSRIKREDGLIRLVPGLGTRAVDRVSDDYPVLIAPGQPRLRVNVTVDEIARYGPKKIDVINLEKRTFESIKINDLLRTYGKDYPAISQLVSVLKETHLEQARPIGTDFTKESFVVTFDGLINRSPFIKQIQAVLTELQDKYGYPVDIEFAHDGKNLYLLQCRSQASRPECKPANIPENIPPEDIIFSATKYISNGLTADITHIVYVDPQKYSELSSYSDLLSIGKAVGQLNKILPKRQFILMGPGRWGSKGDIKLGVNVTYSEINNTAMLIEIARKQKDYLPDLSFGTHFFLDLVEADIRYLPLYPDDEGIIFNENFLLNSPNTLADILPDFAHLQHVIHVIDIQDFTGGRIMQVLLNADSEYAVGILNQPQETSELEKKKLKVIKDTAKSDEHWRWRLQNVTAISAQLDKERFGVVGFYLFGSTKNATAGPGSDIDILIHFRGTEAQQRDLRSWLEGWSLSLSQINYMRTGYRVDGILDVHIITDEDIKNRTSYAAKIGAVTDAARPLAMGTALK